MSAASSFPRGGAAPVRSLWRLVVDHNPFYLLSAVCMMAGCLTLTNSLSYSPLRAGQLLALVFTLNAYELLLVGLGLYLIVRRGVRRDGVFLLLIEAVFLADMAFLDAEVYSIRPMLGVMVNLVVFGLAVGKLAAIFRVLKLPRNDGVFAFVLAELAVLLAMPGVFAEAALGRDGRLSVWMMYGAWWVLGMLVAGYVLVKRKELLTVRSGNVVRDVLLRVLVVVPAVSIVVHLGTANWVYKLPFQLANVGPVLLGMGLVVGHYQAAGIRRRMRGQLLWPALAVWVSTGFPDGLVYGVTGLEWTPLRMVLLGAMMLYLDGLRIHGRGVFGFAAGLCVAGFGMGPSVREMGDNASAAAERTQGWLEWLTPRTGQQWGVVSVVTSFLLLGVGFMVSLMKGPMGKMSDDKLGGNG